MPDGRISRVRFEVLAFSLLSLPHGHKVQALVRIRPVFLSLLIASPLALAAVVCSVLSSRARACRRDRQAPRVPLPDVGVTSIRETCPVSSGDITPRSWLLRTHSPIPSSSPLLWFVASFEESLQIATSLCCSRDLPDVISAILSSDAWSSTPTVPPSALACFFLGVIGLP